MKNKDLFIVGLIYAGILLFQKKSIDGLVIPYKNLSPYTIAKNCVDVADCTVGIDELKRFIRMNYPNSTKLAYKRLSAIYKKLEYLKSK